MTKQEFRRQKSLAEDLRHWQNSLLRNQKSLSVQFDSITGLVLNLIASQDSDTIKDVQQMETNISSYRDIIFAVEGTLIEIGSIEDDLLDLKISTDSIIESLRIMNKFTRKIEASTEEALKLIIKSKRATKKDLIQEELVKVSSEVKNLLKLAKDTLQEISDALNPTLSELQGLQKTSKELLQRKIM